MDLMDVMYRLSNSDGHILGERSTVEDAKALAPSGTVWKWAEAGFPGDCNGRHGTDAYTIRMFAKPNMPTQTHHQTWVTCDVQQFIGGGWRSVFMASSKDKSVTNPDRDAQEWVAVNREVGASYRIARTIRTLILTVDPA